MNEPVKGLFDDKTQAISIDDSDGAHEDTIFHYKDRGESNFSLLSKRVKSPLRYHIRSSSSNDKYRSKMGQRHRKQLVARACMAASCFIFLFWYFSGFTLFKHLTDLSKLGKIDGIERKAESNVIDNQLEPTLGRIRLDVYGESHCPDTTNFWKDQLEPVFEKFKNYILLSYYPFGKARCLNADNRSHKCTKDELLKPDPPTLICQHGEKECQMNTLQNCVQDAVKTPAEWLPILSCLQGNDVNESIAKKCIPFYVGPEAMLHCEKSEKGKELLYKAGVATVSLNPTLYRIPWIVIDGEHVEIAEHSLKTELCNRIKAPKPTDCYE